MSDEWKLTKPVDPENVYWGHIHENGEIDRDCFATNKKDVPLSKAQEAGGWRIARIALVEVE